MRFRPGVLISGVSTAWFKIHKYTFVCQAAIHNIEHKRCQDKKNKQGGMSNTIGMWSKTGNIAKLKYLNQVQQDLVGMHSCVGQAQTE